MLNRKPIAVSLLLVAVSAVTSAQFSKYGVRFRSQIPLNQMPNSPSSGAGCTGYVSSSGREYAIMGVRNGTVIVDVTNTLAPTILTRIPSQASTWHENVTYGSYGYFVTDQVGNGMQIVDLSQVDSGVATLVSTYSAGGLSTVHTIQVNPVSKTLYLNGTNGGLVMLDVTNPVAPVEVGRWEGPGSKYVHDSIPISYTTGPYAGKEILYAMCGSNGIYVLDVTNKANPVVLGFNKYLPSGTYCHSGLITPDRRYLLVNDEFDESQGMVSNASTHIFDIQGPNTVTYLGKFVNPIDAIDHNSRYKDGFMLLAAYRAGIRVYDIVTPTAPRETGFFDSYPGSGFSYDGAWGTFIFPSGTAIISDINGGLFVVDPSEAMDLGAPYLSHALAKGAVIGGNLDDMRKDDGAYYSLEGFSSLNSRRSGILDAFVLETTKLPATRLDITFNGRISLIPNAYLRVMLKSVSSGQWVQVGSWTLGQTETTLSVTNVPSGDYISANGRIEMQIDSLPTGKTASGKFNLLVDMLKVSVHN